MPLIPKDELKKLEHPDEYLFHRYIQKKYFKYAKEFYSVSFLTVKYLIDKFGHDKMLRLIKSFAKNPKKPALEKEFKKIYRMSIKQAARDAVQSFVS